MPSQANEVELLGTYGGDEEHAASAWTSTNRDLDVLEADGRPKRARIPKLLEQLARDGHHTPFEKSALHFLVTCDKASHIHIIKHRIAVAVNAESARYKELKEDRWYTPVDWPEPARRAFDEEVRKAHVGYHVLVERLVEQGVSRKRAKESARFILPHASMVTQDVMFNFRSFMHFLKLRLDDHAQYEIQQIALQMLVHTWRTKKFTASLDAFGYTNARIVEHAERLNMLRLI